MAVAPLRLPTFNAREPFVDKEGRMTPSALRTINGMIQAIETAINTVISIPEIEAAIAAANQAAADAAAAADSANNAAAAVSAQASLANSYPDGVTFSGEDAGADATVSISGHDRVYGDGSSVAVASGTVTGLAYSTLYYIYYEDAARAGGSVTYQATTDTTVAAQTGSTHVIGNITTPAALAADTVGLPVLPPGPGAIA